MGKRPTSFILRKNANGRWSEYDFLLAEAVELLESEYCQRCGQPRYLCHNESDEIRFRVRDGHCLATEQIEHRQKRNAEQKGYDPAGVNLIAVPYSVIGKPLSEYRDPYYEELAKKRQADAARDAADAERMRAARGVS